MAYAIKVKKGFLARTTKKLRDGWISQYGFTTVENPEIARRFGKKESAEEFALMLAIKCPHYLGKLSVGVLVVGDGRVLAEAVAPDRRGPHQRPGHDRPAVLARTGRRRRRAAPPHGDPPAARRGPLRGLAPPARQPGDG